MSGMAFTDDELRRLRQAAPSDCRKGKVTIRLCPMCAITSWVSSYTDEPDETVIETDSSPCQRCQEVHQRSPEIVDWVLAVLNWRERQIRAAFTTSKGE